MKSGELEFVTWFRELQNDMVRSVISVCGETPFLSGYISKVFLKYVLILLHYVLKLMIVD